MRMATSRRDLIRKICVVTRMEHRPSQDRLSVRQLERLALWCDKAVQFNRHIDRTVRDGEEDKSTSAGV